MEEHKEHNHKDPSQLSTPQAIVANAIIIAVAVIVAALLITHGPFSFGGVAQTDTVKKDDTSALNSGKNPSVSPDVNTIKVTKDTPYIGDANAPVVIAYWSDYQCPFCKKFETGVMSKVIDQYVKTGKVKIIFKDFSFLGTDSDIALVYAHAVWALYPDSYLAWREAMYKAQDGENTGFGDEASVLKLTGTIAGIDATKVQVLADNSKVDYIKMADADKAEANGFNIQGTPTIIVDKNMIQGAVSFDTVDAAIKADLK